VRGQSAPEPPARIKAAQWERTRIAAVLAVLLRGIVAAWLKAVKRSPRVKTNMWRVVAILALSLSGCVSNRSISQPMDFWEGLFIGYLITVLWLVFIYWLVSKSLPSAG
jgi:EamA domain-containing membrane protein RarD